MPPTKSRIEISEGATIALQTYEPRKGVRGRAVLAHGAGADQTHPFMVAFAEGLAERGIETTTFNFGYTERKKKSPDTNATLEACYRKVFASMKKPVVLGGKSMGGRIASQIVAGGAAARGLFFLGYPLHPPGQAQKLRIAHWPKITVACLFVQGSRDPFGSPEELAKYTGELGGSFDVHSVTGGDHSLGVTKKVLAEQGKTQAEVLADAMNAVAVFIAACCKK